MSKIVNDANIIFKISSEYKKQLKKEAEQKGLTLSSYIKMILDGRNK